MDEKTLILGHSRDTREIAEKLLQKNQEVIVAFPSSSSDATFLDDLKTGSKADKIEILPVTGSFSCSGSVGDFNLMFNGNGEPISRTVSAIILADTVERKPNFHLYGARESSAVVSLTRAQELIESGSGSAIKMLSGKRIAFVTGLVDESNPVITEEVLRCVLQLQQEFGSQTYIFTGNLKVAANGLETLYRHTKKTGAVYIKFTETVPNIQIENNGTLTMTYFDEVIQETFKLNPDLTIIDESLESSPFSQHFANLLDIDTGPDGFGQSDNVHRATILTNRKGIFVAGFSRRVQTADERRADVSNAALSVLNLYKNPPEEKAGKAEINFTGHCIRCLTCFRVCPHGAITINPKVRVDTRACEGCGICEAECPRFVIKMNAPVEGPMTKKIADSRNIPESGDFTPSIMAFCCSRSARGARDLACSMGYSLPSGLNIVEVPCAGNISMDHLLAAFSKGADGVVVLSCHLGNCHSENGTTYAHQRVNRASDLLTPLGFEPERLLYKTLASNMGTEFAETACQLERAILKLGPSRITRA